MSSFVNIPTKVNTKLNKKVLRERKRHTTRRVASARYAALSPNRGGGGYPTMTWTGGSGGTLPSRPGMEYPLQEGGGTPPQLDGVPPPISES